jgi:hypothetical protein
MPRSARGEALIRAGAPPRTSSHLLAPPRAPDCDIIIIRRSGQARGGPKSRRSPGPTGPAMPLMDILGGAEIRAISDIGRTPSAADNPDSGERASALGTGQPFSPPSPASRGAANFIRPTTRIYIRLDGRRPMRASFNVVPGRVRTSRWMRGGIDYGRGWG